MKFHIIYCAALLAVAPVVKAAPCFSKKPTPTPSPVLVWSRGTRLEAARLGGSPIAVLREQKESIPNNAMLFGWNLSPDGQQLVFAATPQDVDFFDAGAYRQYVFLARFNTPVRVLLAAYGPQAVADRASFFGPRFDATGQKLVVEEDEIGQFMDSSSHHWIGIYDIKTRRRTFDSRQFVKELPKGKLKTVLYNSLLESPSLSPDGNDLVCLAFRDDGDSVADSVTYPPQLVHLDLKRKSAEILISPNDRLPAERRITATGTAAPNVFPHTFSSASTWHPTQKKFVFGGTLSVPDAPSHLFAFDLASHKITRLTDSKQSDYSAQWSRDGKQIFWIRGNFQLDKGANNQIFRANTDGSNVTAILSHVKGATQIQLLPQLADWSRYRKLSIEPLAGKDK